MYSICNFIARLRVSGGDGISLVQVVLVLIVHDTMTERWSSASNSDRTTYVCMYVCMVIYVRATAYSL